MTIDRLRTLLGAIGPSATALEIAEMLWLATHLPHGDDPVVTPDMAVATTDEAGGTTTQPDSQDSELPPHSVSEDELNSSPPGRQSLHGMRAMEPSGADAVDVAIPTAPFLRRPLRLQRALRQLKRPVESTSRYEFDEAATASSAAQQPPGMPWVPSFRPAAERWLKLTLVVDTGPTMQLWQPLARELRDIMTHVGAFSDVRVWTLVAGRGKPAVRLGSGPALPPTTLLDSAGRQAIVVLSDCSGEHWWNRRVGPALRQWASAAPTVIVQPLPERMWRRTAAPIISGWASARHPAAPNVDLDFVPFDGEVPAARGDVPIPVIQPTPRWFADWAQLLSVPDAQIPTAVTFQGRTRDTSPDSSTSTSELTIRERVLRFRAVASPNAMTLAAHTAVSEPNLAVMRLIQHRLLKRSRPSDLAEVLLSGFLREVDGSPGQYRFVPGARKALLETLPRHASMSTAAVLEAVSDEIRSRLGADAEVFRAGLRVTDGMGQYGLAPWGRPFAEVSDEALSYLMPQSSRVTVTAEPPSSLRLPDPARSTAVLIGVDRCVEEEGLVFPQVDNDLVDLRRVLMDPMICGLSADRIHTFENPTSRDVPAIIAVLQTAADIRFVYFSGHSFMTHDGSLYLALDGPATEGLGAASLPFSDIHKVVERNVAGNNLFLFNGCHSEVGQYIDQVMTPRRLAGNLHVTTSSFAQDLVWDRQSRNTPLVEALVSALTYGISNGHSLISVDDLSEHLRDRLTLGEHPVPLQWARTETDVNFALANNRMADGGAARRGIDELQDKSDPETTDSRLLRAAGLPAALALAEVGDDEAIWTSWHEAEVHMRLAESDPNRYEPDLASSLHKLSERLFAVRRYDAALSALQQALEVRTRLAEVDPGRYEPDFAASLHWLSELLSNAGRRGEAIVAAQKAVEVRTRLAGVDPGRFEPDLAASLQWCGSLLAHLGRHAEALTASERAVQIYSQLADATPQHYEPDLAIALNNLGNRLSSDGRHSEALATIRSAALICARLAEDDPEEHLPSFAVSLSNLSICLSNVGRYDDALDAIRQVVDIRNRLVQADPDRYSPDLAEAHHGLSSCLSELGRYNDALDAIRRAVDIRNRLVLADPGRYYPDLARSVRRLSSCLSDVSRDGDSIVAIRRAVDMYFRAVQTNPEQYQSDLGECLLILCNRLLGANNKHEALEIFQRAVDSYARLAEGDPDQYQPVLAVSLYSISNHYAAAMRIEDALAAIQWATDIYEGLAATNMARYGPALAATLHKLSARLANAGRAAEAVDAAQQAVSLYIGLDRLHPKRHQPMLATARAQLARLTS